MQKYKHLFFDLDHTIWDFSTNEEITLGVLFEKYKLNRFFKDFNDFFDRYKPINIGLWTQYRNGEIRKQDLNINRFYNTFITADFNNKPEAENFAHDFVTINPTQTALIPYTIELLDYLKPRYNMHIITNGFKETQYVKLDRSGLRPYFKKIFVDRKSVV